MKNKMLPGGLWPVMLTPFKSDLSIDFQTLKQLVDFYLSHGAAGLFANCLSSEMYHLEPDERIHLIREVVTAVRGRIPVVASGTFGSNIRSQIEFIKSVYDLGVNAVIMITSQLITHSEQVRVLEEKFAILIEKTKDIPLGVYECPEPYTRFIPPDMLGRIAKTGRFFYHKDTSCDSIEIRKKVEATAGTVLGIFNANTPTAMDSILAGAKGLSPVSANFFPEFFTRFYNEIKQSGENEMTKRMQDYLTLMDAVTRIKYPLSAKIFLGMRGIRIRAETRIPVARLKFEEKKMIKSLYNLYTDFKDKFEI